MKRKDESFCLNLWGQSIRLENSYVMQITKHFIIGQLNISLSLGWNQNNLLITKHLILLTKLMKIIRQGEPGAERPL